MSVPVCLSVSVSISGHPSCWLYNSIMRLSWLSLSMCLFPFAVRTSLPLDKDLSIYQLQCPLRPSFSYSQSVSLCVSLFVCVCFFLLLNTQLLFLFSILFAVGTFNFSVVISTYSVPVLFGTEIGSGTK